MGKKKEEYNYPTEDGKCKCAVCGKIKKINKMEYCEFCNKYFCRYRNKKGEMIRHGRFLRQAWVFACDNCIAEGVNKK